MNESSVDDTRAPETADASLEGRRVSSFRELKVPLLIGGLVLSLLLAGTMGFLVVRMQETSPADVSGFLEAQRPEVENVSARVLTLIVNFDATNIERQRDRLLRLTTGTFREQYEEAFQSLGEGLRSVSVSSRGEIIEGPNVSFKSASEAVALATLTETIQSDEDPTGITFVNEIKLTLVNTAGGGWKADRAEILATRES